jgi:hypothetical protein
MRFAPGLATGTALLLLPPLFVGAWGLVPGLLCIPLALAALVPSYRWLRGGEARLRDVRVTAGQRATGALLLLLAILQLGRVGVFVVDPARPSRW